MSLRWRPQHALTVVMATRGYPGAVTNGSEIRGLEALDGLDELLVFHAATRRDGDRILAAGGRVLGITGIGATLRQAREHAYAGIRPNRVAGRLLPHRHRLAGACQLDEAFYHGLSVRDDDNAQMSETPSLAPPVAELIWPAGDGLSRSLRDLALALAGSLFIWAAAEADLPFYPVPLTLQTAAVFIVGMAYGPQLAATTVLLYLLEGALGLPVFAGTPEQGSGIAYIVGPTGGYLASFVAAAAIAGWVTARRGHWSEIAGGLLVATAVIYLLGAGWLACHIGWKEAMALGIRPFLLGDLLKLVLVTLLAETGLVPAQRRLSEA